AAHRLRWRGREWSLPLRRWLPGRISSGGLPACAAPRPKRLYHLREDGNGNLGRHERAYIDADRRMDAVDLRGTHAHLLQPFDAFCVRLAAAQRPDIETARIERGLQG